MAPGSDIFAPVEVRLEKRADGGVLLSNGLALAGTDDTLIDRLRGWATRTPDRIHLAERAGADWRRLTYGQVWERTGLLARRLLGLSLDARRPLMILAPNSIDHALMALAAMRIGAPAATVSIAHAASPGQLDKLRNAVSVLTPGALYLEGSPSLEAAVRGLAPRLPILTSSSASTEGVTALKHLPLAPEAELAAASDRIGADTIAKFLFTSGSTGAPKAVPNTHRMMVSNMDGLGQIWPFLTRRPPILVDWLPWSHTFGGNFCFNMALVFGGSFYIDGGRPPPAEVGRTIDNLRDIQPTLYLSVPGGFDALLPFLEADADFAGRFLGGLDILFNAGSAMPASTRERLDALAARVRSKPLPVIGSWGSTETAPSSTAVYFPAGNALNIGLPLPGVTVKLAPDGARSEMRVRGPNVMAGYWRQDSAGAFDEEGFYRMGDAGAFADPEHPEAGLVFNGRTAENFKLSSGTWVNVGALRLAAIATAHPLIADAVITGHDRTEVGLMVFPHPQACRAYLDDGGAGLTDEALAVHPRLIAALTLAFQAHNLTQSGASTRLARFIVLSEPPSPALGEITDKGYLNQRAVLDRRAAQVAALHAEGHRVDEALGQAAKTA